MPQTDINISPAIYIRNPLETKLGRKIIKYGIQLIYELGYEEFTFKKLALQIKTNEAGVYRYFENKHCLLTYIINWFWSGMSAELSQDIINIKDAGKKINAVLELLSFESYLENEDDVQAKMLYNIIISEGNKVFLIRDAETNNKNNFFTAYLNFCESVGEIFREYNPEYPESTAFAQSIIEMLSNQWYYKKNIPQISSADLNKYISHIVFSVLEPI